ncbi:VENN motif pre-toxin domain-containing protein [Ignatzschineria indica]|uniref:VENN motif pre-toxin domain-containing protein n=1 Tax=Ignatzschineria indica TaxID=472583 RepID=UPI0025788C78|nr:VENN motif pre-toxin domain-containing protein [Ignatzschineria indica]
MDAYYLGKSGETAKNILAGALTAGGAEALAPIIAEFLYGKEAKDLTAEEKNTLSAIIGILGAGAGALTGDSAIDAVIGDSVATNAVENNYLQFVLGSGSSLVEGSFLIGGSSTLLDKEDLGEGLAGLLNSILNDLGYGDLDNYANEDGDIDLGTLDSRALEEVKTQTREAYAYAFGKRDQIDNSYFTNNEFGQLLGKTLEIVGVDSQGNPVYSANSRGAGDWINQGDKVVLSDDGQTWDVYTEDGYFLSSLDINGTKSRYITGLKKGSKLVFNPATSEDFGNTLVTIPPKVDNPQEGYIKPEIAIPNHTGDMSGAGKVDTDVIVGGGTNPVDPNDFGGNILESEKLTNKERAEAANGLGYKQRIPPQKLPFNSHGQPGYWNGKNYITPDIDGHNVTNGWKVFDRRGKRIGTYDADLNFIKD